MNEPGSTKDQIRDFLTPIALRAGVRSFSDEESLVASAVITSLALFRIVAFLEETFSVAITDEEIVIENFESIDKIDQLLQSKLRNS